MVKTRAEIEIIVNRYVSELEKEGINVTEVILFGSYSSNTAKDYSDIDLAVISEDFRKLNLRERLEKLGIANINLQESIQALGYSPEQIRTRESGTFLDEILKTGEVIFKT